MTVEQGTRKDGVLWNLEPPPLETFKAVQGSKQPHLPWKLTLLWARGWTRRPSEICSNLNYCVILYEKDRELSWRDGIIISQFTSLGACEEITRILIWLEVQHGPLGKEFQRYFHIQKMY